MSYSFRSVIFRHFSVLVCSFTYNFRFLVMVWVFLHVCVWTSKRDTYIEMHHSESFYSPCKKKAGLCLWPFLFCLLNWLVHTLPEEMLRASLFFWTVVVYRLTLLVLSRNAQPLFTHTWMIYSHDLEPQLMFIPFFTRSITINRLKAWLLQHLSIIRSVC